MNFTEQESFAVRNSTFEANGELAMRNNSTVLIDAQANYWGSASGPLDNSDEDGRNFLNPSGGGGPVSEHVDWNNFLGAPPGGAATVPLELSITHKPSGEVVLSWPAAASDAVLEHSMALGGTSWQPAGLPFIVEGDLSRATVYPLEAKGFFRLRRP